MSLDFQQVHRQIEEMGENAPQRERRLRSSRSQAQELLDRHAQDLHTLRAKVERAAQQAPTLRCARPASEPLNAHYAQPAVPPEGTLVAADGSQIAPDRHNAVDYYLINVGVIQMQLGSSSPPETHIRSHLYYGDDLETSAGMVSEGQVTLERDLSERLILAERAPSGPGPVITLTDGPLELWGAKEGFGSGGRSFRDSLERYKTGLIQLHRLGTTTAGYVDRPRADLVVRLLEIAALPEEGHGQAGRSRRFQGVSDRDLLQDRLAPGERSAVFGLQSQSVVDYTGELALHFFYINVGREERPWLARAEIPAWVAGDPARLDELHAVLVDQCRALGTRPFPYLLHRAHETAVVSLDEKEQLTQMIALELRRRGIPVGEPTHKQAVKDMRGRRRHTL